MPLYEYACDQCGVRTEVMQKVGAPPLLACPHCGGPVHKVLAPPALQFKGSGWYVTDYARRGNGSSGRTEGSTSTDTAASQAKGSEGSAGDGEKPT
ncbi:MAG: FmdB family zinc ribbon protein [Thermoanaerobaculum sp.]